MPQQTWSDSSELTGSASRPTNEMSSGQLQNRQAQQSQGKTRDQLYEEAKRRDIPGRSNMTKSQLQYALNK